MVMIFEVTWSREICAKKPGKTLPSRRRSSECPDAPALKILSVTKSLFGKILRSIVREILNGIFECISKNRIQYITRGGHSGSKSHSDSERIRFQSRISIPNPKFSKLNPSY